MCTNYSLADIVEFNATAEQLESIKVLQNTISDKYCFATEKMILSNKRNHEPDCNKIDIADHTYKILETHEKDLDKRKPKKYIINICLT